MLSHDLSPYRIVVPCTGGLCAPASLWSHDLSPYRIVVHYYRTWQQVNVALCQQTRQSQGCHPEPSAAITDRQSVKTTEKGPLRLRRRQKGNGYKRHIVVDT